MCTLIVAWQVFEEAPVCVAANRDEAAGRPSVPPRRWETDPPAVAPRDERAGGTWLGYNAEGVLAAITNRWKPGEGERSRGLLVGDALGEPSARRAADRIETELREREYAPCHPLVADAEDCLLVVHDGGDRVTVRRLDPGVHVVVNVGFDGEWFLPDRRRSFGRRQADNAERVRGTLRPESGEGAPAWTDRAGTVLGDHEYGVCVHGDGFGTRSSSLVRLGTERAFDYADGPPCETPFRRVEPSV
ncbi:NRDE domain protein [Natronomonas moolapensis 8.8.11]|uniref:NRDE domain protein n=1 Tax=Natronomonas moolapensis (strain DSM 18674 / CECT 7526 / JCM 14361 / 8.8.11) TaxID=268739 RepID=M1XSB9_NATM8|nr:NRDE family protein [Natronomonas moolapensis]CCQ37212.1 NRDE domain protein [Natronomonas moolapensis 8.8.11]